MSLELPCPEPELRRQLSVASLICSVNKHLSGLRKYNSLRNRKILAKKALFILQFDLMCGSITGDEYASMHFHIQMKAKGNWSDQVEYRNYEGQLMKFHSENT